MPVMNTQTSTTDFSVTLPEHWAEEIVYDAIREEFWAPFEGTQKSGSAIATKMDFTTQPGKTIHFTAKSRLRNAGVTGHTTLEGSEGETKTAQFDLTVDWVRNAVATDKKTNKEIFWDWLQDSKSELSDWMARKKDADLFDHLLTNSGATTIYAGGKTADTALDSNQTFGTAEIDRIKLALIRKGAKALKIFTDRGQMFQKFGIVISEIDEYYLRQDPVWFKAQENAANRGEGNPLFDGSIGEWNGCLIFVHRGLAGDQGTPLRPETSLSSSLGTGGTTATVYSDTTIDATEFFPSSGTLQIYRASDGLYEYVTYSGKTVNTFTGLSRGQTYGSDSDGATALAFVADDKITLNRSMSRQIGFGAMAACRGWGLLPRGTTNMRDYDFEIGAGIEAVFGQAAYENQAGNCPNYIIMDSNAETPDVNL